MRFYQLKYKFDDNLPNQSKRLSTDVRFRQFSIILQQFINILIIGSFKTRRFSILNFFNFEEFF